MSIELIVDRMDITELRFLQTGKQLENVVYEKTAIVNAANGYLQHGGGVAWAISSKAGPKFQKDSDALYERVGETLDGQVVVQEGDYNLPGRYVIHAVGPVWNGREKEMEKLIKDAYRNSLMEAERLGLDTVAFPAISTGIFGFPKDKAARYVKEVLESFEYKSVKRVVMCFFGEEDMAIFKSNTGYQARQTIK